MTGKQTRPPFLTREERIEQLIEAFLSKHWLEKEDEGSGLFTANHANGKYFYCFEPFNTREEAADHLRRDEKFIEAHLFFNFDYPTYLYLWNSHKRKWTDDNGIEYCAVDVGAANTYYTHHVPFLTEIQMWEKLFELNYLHRDRIIYQQMGDHEDAERVMGVMVMKSIKVFLEVGPSL